MISDFVVLFLVICDCRLCDVSFLRCWLPDVEQPEVKETEIKKYRSNKSVHKLSHFNVLCSAELISLNKNNSVCICLFNYTDKNNDAGKKRND